MSTATTPAASNNVFKNITGNLTKTANAIVETATGAVSTVAENLGAIPSSLFPATPSTGSNNAAKATNNAAKATNNAAKATNNAAKATNEWGFNIFEKNTTKSANNTAKAANNAVKVNANTNTKSGIYSFFGTLLQGTIARYVLLFLGLFGTFALLFYFYSEHIKQGYQQMMDAIKRFFGMHPHHHTDPTVVHAAVTPTQGANSQTVTVPPNAPQNTLPGQVAAANAPEKSLVETLLPTAAAASKDPAAEVYNVNENDYTYYDAEPLCQALGAELATYEQVKDAWSKGADWCNYGWVKGQMAIYPTQKETYDMLQAGPADQHTACGTPGINGGFFENPEMRYGVNCYGKKPSQSAHDKQELMKEGKVPLTPAALKVQQKANEFKAEADSIFVVPFSNGAWSQK